MTKVAPPQTGSGPSLEFQRLVDSVNDYAIITLDRDGLVLTWNEGARRLKGYRADEIIGRSFEAFYTAHDIARGRPRELLGMAVRDGRVEDESWRVRADGTRFWADVVISCVRDDDGRPVAFIKVTRDLTERKRAEEALRQSEERFGLLIGSVKDYAIFMLDPEGCIVSWNQGAELLKGYAADEVLGKHISLFYLPEDAAAGRPQRLLGIAEREGRVEDIGWRRRKDGSLFWADVVLTRVQDATGRLLGFAKVTRDLSEQREYEEALRRSEERLRLMIDRVQDYAIFMLDPQGRVTSWNSGAERLNGYPAEEIIGRSLAVFYPPEDAAAGKPERELEIATAVGRYEEEGWRVRRDGSRFWAGVVVNSIVDASGTLVGFTKITRDMTERRRAEAELALRARQNALLADIGLYALRTRDVEAVFQHVVQQVEAAMDGAGRWAVGLVELGADGTIQSRIGAVAPETLIRAAVSSGASIVVDDLAHPPVALEDSDATGSTAVLLVQGASEDEAPYGVFTVSSTAPGALTNDVILFLEAVASVVATAVARRRAEERAEQERDRSERAEAAVRERDTFISTAAHELRTPLAALQLKLQGLERLLQRQDAKAELPRARVEERLSGAVQQTGRLAHLVERLLDTTRIANDQLVLDPQPADMTVIVQHVLEVLRDHAANAHCELRFSATGDAEGCWDAARLEQVLMNLVENAIKYGSGSPIDVSVRGHETRVTVDIEDRGIGISPEDAERIFLRFERTAPLQHYPGLGLGLYIARRLIEGHGGTIGVRSTMGGGSTFTIDLPRQSIHRREEGADER